MYHGNCHAAYFVYLSVCTEVLCQGSHDRSDAAAPPPSVFRSMPRTAFPCIRPQGFQKAALCPQLMIMECPGFTKEIRRDVLARFLYQQYINAPDSIFKDVYKLQPGEILRFHKGEIKTWKYWDIADVYHKMQKNPVTDFGEAKAELKRLFQKAVASRMIADVPLGSFLSGGYDSSLMTAVAQENSPEPVKTFSIGFEDERYDEASYARQVAEYLGTDRSSLPEPVRRRLHNADSLMRTFRPG